jgi:hypothetical protein
VRNIFAFADVGTTIVVFVGTLLIYTFSSTLTL